MKDQQFGKLLDLLLTLFKQNWGWRPILFFVDPLTIIEKILRHFQNRLSGCQYRLHGRAGTRRRAIDDPWPKEFISEPARQYLCRFLIRSSNNEQTVSQCKHHKQ